MQKIDIEKTKKIYLENKPYYFKIQRIHNVYQILQVYDNQSIVHPIGLNQRIQIDQWVLQLQNKETGYTRYHLVDNLLIGRDSTNHLSIINQNVSKIHARIYYEKNWIVEDLGSTNGIYVNRQKVTKKTLEIGDLISIVGCDIYFSLIFIVVPQSINSNLSLFKPNYQFTPIKGEMELVVLDNVQEPMISNNQSLSSPSRMSDIISPTIYILLLLYYQQYSYFIWISLFNLLLRIIEKGVSFYKRNKQYKSYIIELDRYQSYLNRKYPNIDELGKMNILSNYDWHKVRIGTNEKGVCLYDFKINPHLAIVGNKEKAKSLVIQIVYQILRLYPNIEIDINQPFFELLFIDSKSSELHLGINKDGDYSIVMMDELDESLKSYSGVIHLDEGWYYCGVKETFILDTLNNPLIISDLYANKALPKRIDFDFYELTFKDLKQIRLSVSSANSIRGILGYYNQKLDYLDLHEQKQGPHLLIVGMSGSGKSEWLTSYLLSLAIFYDSDDIQFFIIDFKGGLLCMLFEQLHHTCMVLSNLENYQIHRAIAALEDELRYRENLLLRISKEVNLPINDIYQLKKLYHQKRINDNLAHLIIVVDEFAELKMTYPEMMSALIRISRTGRSLGIHLVLCTQRASGIIDRQIESNIQTTICFKVASKQDSYDALGNQNAFYLQIAGDLICKNASEQSYSRTIFLEQQSIFRFYDLEKTEKYQFSIQNHHQSKKLLCIHQINRESEKCNPLYIKDFEQIKLNSFGIYDDYKNRKVVHFEKDDIAFVVGATIEEDGVYTRGIYERINNKELTGDLGIIFFDSQVVFNTLMKRVNFEINKEKRLGAFYLKGELYQCKIISPVI